MSEYEIPGLNEVMKNAGYNDVVNEDFSDFDVFLNYKSYSRK
ncbi:MAG: hypothetical protein ACQESM_05875 [Bacteroidota bacterium]